MRLSPALVAAALSISLLTACGGGDDDGGSEAADTGGDTLSKTEFISQGDAICAQLEADGEALGAPATEEEFGPFIRESVTFAQDARADFAALVPPEDGEQVQQALLDALDGAIESAEGAATAAEGGDTVTAGDLLTEASDEAEAADAEAQEYGFQECGKPDEEEDSAAAGALTKEEFIASGDAICQSLDDSTQAVAAPADETDLARYLNEVLPLAADARVAFAELSPPEDGVAVQEELLAALDATIDGGSAAAVAAEQGDTVTADDLLTQTAAAGDAANASAQAYGFQSCGNDAG